MGTSLSVSSAVATHDVLFTPFRLGGLTLKNRLVMAPMGTCLDRGGDITDETIAYYRRRARGGVGAITVEGCLVSPDTVGPEPGIHSDRFLAGLAGLTGSLRPYDVTVGVQLMHPGRQVVEGPSVAPSAIPLNSMSPLPRALHVDEIATIVEDYGRAAARARAAGFQFVEIHGAHGYLPSNFLSPRDNIRDDRYGGDLRGRARFCLEIVESIRRCAGDDFAIVWRLNGDDAVPGGFGIAEATRVSQWLADAGVAAISVSAGTWHTLHVTLAPMSAPRGQMLPLAGSIKRAIDIPVIAVGRLDEPDLASRAIEGGDADFILLGRALIAEPDWPNKVKAGQDRDRPRPCIACNACVDLVARGEHAKCAVNPEAGRELSWQIVPSELPRRVMVVGSGPAGMEAARIARLRGHEVTIWERSNRIGGKLEVASLAPSKGEVLRFRDYQAATLHELGVEIRLGVDVTAETIAREAPDVVIIATGAEPLVPPIPGIGSAHVYDAQQLLRSEITVGSTEHVAIVGGSATGCETAEFLVGKAGSVTVVEMGSSVGLGVEAITRRLLIRALRKQGVNLLTRSKVVMIEPDGIVYENVAGETDVLQADRVALALGWAPNGDMLAAELSGSGADPDRELIVLGDASRPADFVAAINAGADAGLRI
jgi:2,4-dienoyl-CoA reductase (NADPH2)